MNWASAGGREAPTPTGITVIRCIINLLSFSSQKSVKQGIRYCSAINFCLFHYIETQEQLDPNLCGTNHKMFSFRGKYKKIMWQKNEESAAAESAKGRLSRFILSASAKDLEISDHRKDKKKSKKMGNRNTECFTNHFKPWEYWSTSCKGWPCKLYCFMDHTHSMIFFGVRPWIT